MRPDSGSLDLFLPRRLRFDKIENLSLPRDRETILGYFPCLTDRFGLEREDVPIEYVREIEEELLNIRLMSWYDLPGEEKKYPILYINRAKEVVTHLASWCRGDTSWFRLVWESNHKNYYTLALIPDLERFLKNHPGYETKLVLQWVWCFNSKEPNGVARENLEKRGKQKIFFGDYETREIVGSFLFPVSRFCEIKMKSPWKRAASTYMFKS